MRTVAAMRMAKFVGVMALLLAPIGLSTTGGDDRPAAKAKQGPRIFKGRLIAPVMTAEGGGAEWLERRDRDETEQPEKVLDALKIAPGAVVADVGAGTGYFSIRIARRLGPDGKVLATDVQPEMLRQLTENMKKAGLKNIDRILATANDAKLPAGKVDLVLMVDVYHELQDPERTMAQIRKSLKDDGRLVLVEYRGEDPSVPIKPEHKTTLRQMRYEIEPMGFRLNKVFEFLPHQHVEVFVRDEVKNEDPIIDPNSFPTIRKPGWAGVATSEPYEKAGFQRLFNGKDLTDWTDDSKSWRVRDDSLVAEPRESAKERAELRTSESYGDFELDLLWRMKDMDGGGIWIGSNPRHFIQLDSGTPYLPGYPQSLATRRTGEVSTERGLKPVCPTNDTANAVVLTAEWNRLTVRSQGRRVQVAINGVPTGSFELESGTSPGPIGLSAVRGEVEFRSVWLKRLGQD